MTGHEELPPLGDPSLPRYFHRQTGLVQHIHGSTVRQRDAAKNKLRRLVKASGGDPETIEYRAGVSGFGGAR